MKTGANDHAPMASEAEPPEVGFVSTMQDSTLGASAVGPNASATGIVIVNQGMSFTETETLFGLLFEQNFPRLAETARTEARRRVDEFAATFTRIAATQHVNEEQLAGFAEPDVQFALNSAIQTNARRDSQELRELLARLIVQRLQAQDQAMMGLVLGEAVSAAGRLIPSQFHALALCFLTMYTNWFDGPVSWQACNAFLHEMVAPFLSTSMCNGDLLHLEYAGCVAFDQGPPHSFITLIGLNYNSLFDIEAREVLHESQRMIAMATKESPILKSVIDLSEQARFYMLRPTTVGFVLAATVIEQVTGKRLPIDKWLG